MSLFSRIKSENGWDIVIRLIHWSVAILFLVNYYFTESGYTAHIRVGYTILGLVIFRLLWGLTWSRGPNRLSSFVPSIAGAKEHWHEIKTRQPVAETKHNTFGACAIYLLWFGLLAAVFTGWFQDTDWGFDNDVAEWHEFIVESLAILIVIHIVAVVVTSIWLRKNLILNMLTGK